NASSWEMPPLFKWLQEQGNIAPNEMYKTFNCGIGMAVIVAQEDVDLAQKILADKGETVYRIGKIRQQHEGEAATVVV
ncbi:MAG TPA: AIR synthase-related protein, partial [Methylophilaceae bacterium]|nr:AIR synthase-related protein [Methylophilaceae bacterium]